MKRLALALIATASLLQARAYDPDSEGVMYIYRNDGIFDAFRHSQIDSIKFSKYDLDSVMHDHFVVQEIWSNNVVNRVAINRIDNIGFEQPQTIVSNDVFPMTVAHDQYIVAADTLHFAMLPNVPDDMRPRRGNIVVAQPDCQAFSNGILARVTDVDVDSEGIYRYACEAASIDDIYEQIVFYGIGDVETEPDPNAPAQAPRRISQEFNKEIWNKDFDGTIAKLGGTKYHANDRATAEIKVCKTLGTPLYASITLNNAFTGNVSLNYSTTKDYDPDPVQIGQTIRCGRISFPNPIIASLIWLEPQIKFFGYFKAHGELDVNFAAHLNRTDAVNVTYSDKKWSINHTPTMDCAVDTANLSMRGFVEVGLIPEITLALNGSATGIGITGKVGLKQTLDLMLDAREWYDTSFYQSVGDTHTDTYLTYNTSIFVQSGLFDKDTPRKSYTILDNEKLLLSKYLFPKFTTASYYQLTDGTSLVKVSAERDVLLPQTLGLSLFDDDDNLVATSADVFDYNGKRPTTYAFTFRDLDLTKTYNAYPMIHVGDMTMRATPAFAINQCPVQIDSITLSHCYYDRSYPTAPNTMVYAVNFSLREPLPADATEWGVAIGTYLYPYEPDEEEGDAEDHGSMYFSMGVPDNYTMGTGFRIDYYNYVFEAERTARVYVKRVSTGGRESIMYSDPFTATLRYDDPPCLTYTDPKIESINLIRNYTDSTGKFIQEFKAAASFTMTLTGTFWLNYIDGGISGNFSLSNNPQWKPTYDGTWRTSWETNYISTDVIDHSNWHNLHLRYTGRVVQSDRLNWISGSNGYLDRVTVTPSTVPAKAPARVDAEPDMHLDNDGDRPVGSWTAPLPDGRTVTIHRVD